MKKLAILILILTLPAIAGAVVLGQAVTTTGAQTSVGVAHINAAHWDCDITLSGTVTAAVVRIEGNQGGSLFSSVGMFTKTCDATELSEGICSFSILNQGANNMRAYVTTLTGTGATIDYIRCNGRK